MKIERQEVEHVARLARLKVTDEDVSNLTREMNNILTYIDKLGELDTSDIEPMAHALSLPTPLRQDLAGQSLNIDESLANAPERNNNFLVVPKVI
jgi:aspartyl-tRNA(Asn)/glutamyl-tRNA(Gln) amidotransferase subunit C